MPAHSIGEILSRTAKLRAAIASSVQRPNDTMVPYEGHLDELERHAGNANFKAASRRLDQFQRNFRVYHAMSGFRKIQPAYDSLRDAIDSNLV